MAKQIEFDKFLIIECTAKELMAATSQTIVCCDYCSDIATANNCKGYYVAVLNQWYCNKCFREWKKRAKWHHEDANVEQRNFTFYAHRLGINVSKG